MHLSKESVGLSYVAQSEIFVERRVAQFSRDVRVPQERLYLGSEPDLSTDVQIEERLLSGAVAGEGEGSRFFLPNRDGEHAFHIIETGDASEVEQG